MKDILLDTGASTTLVRSDLVPEEKMTVKRKYRSAVPTEIRLSTHKPRLRLRLMEGVSQWRQLWPTSYQCLYFWERCTKTGGATAGIGGPGHWGDAASRGNDCHNQSTEATAATGGSCPDIGGEERWNQS